MNLKLAMTFTTKDGYTYQIIGKPVDAVTAAHRMEFSITGHSHQFLIINLSLQAAILMKLEDPKFDPYEWLWERGCQMISQAAELNKLENGDFYILEQNIRDYGDKLTLDKLEKKS
ncbi:hypothetical protein EFBL_3766 [Effusibacillus lacus]|uniref:Uncharacterized protein n=1 Tax=Effusibacillus lacus TaxID=1348429 RepID=A0A292YU95_9BACL|nr:hypothetical protein EFBL_3766 [Effusibacillus lacus]